MLVGSSSRANGEFPRENGGATVSQDERSTTAVGESMPEGKGGRWGTTFCQPTARGFEEGIRMKVIVMRQNQN